LFNKFQFPSLIRRSWKYQFYKGVNILIKRESLKRIKQKNIQRKRRRSKKNFKPAIQHQKNLPKKRRSLWKYSKLFNRFWIYYIIRFLRYTEGMKKKYWKFSKEVIQSELILITNLMKAVKQQWHSSKVIFQF
jgi:hypothetical protein